MNSQSITEDYQSDSHSIWTKAYIDGRTKYEAGHSEHKTKFWTAGAIWYANNLRNEALDAVAYSHHLKVCLYRIHYLASMMETGELEGKKGGMEIVSILNGLPHPENNEQQ